MRHLYSLAGIALLLGLCAGCATTSGFDLNDPAVAVPATARFKIGEIKDISGFTPGEGELDPAQAMRDALRAGLFKTGLWGGDWQLETQITEYVPGNAFARWVVPGLGGTYLKTTTFVLDENGKVIAEISVNRMVASGGAFSVGAWRECFKEVAEETVNVLKDQMGL